MIDDAKIAQMRAACNGSKNKPWAGMIHDLLDEIERLRAKCEERKAVLVQHELCDRYPSGAPRCEHCRRESGHKDDCAWKRAMEDV